MKRSIKTGLLLVSVMQANAALQTRLPDNFYILDKTGQSNLFDTSTPPRAFFIVVGNTPTAPFSDPNSYQKLTGLISPEDATLPAGFVPRLPASGNTINLYFNWEDQVGFKNIRDYGKIFAHGIHTLVTAYAVPCIIVSFNRGGLLVNYASQQWTTPSLDGEPLPTLIQIGTPIPTPVKNHADLMPNPKGIGTLFFFYSKQPFVIDQPTLHPEYQATYTNIPELSVYNILVLLNNKQPLQHSLPSQLLAQNLISCCNTARTNYTINRNLFLNLSTLKPETNGAVGIAAPSSSKKTDQGAQELVVSNGIIKNLTESLGRDLALTISQGEYLRNSHRA